MPVNKRVISVEWHRSTPVPLCVDRRSIDCLRHDMAPLCCNGPDMNNYPKKFVIPVVCVKIGKSMWSNTVMSIKVYLMVILDN